MNQLEILDDVLKLAVKAGADAADAYYEESKSTVVQCRNGSLENTGGAENGDLSLRVFVGGRSAKIASAGSDWDNLATIVEQAVVTAKHAPENPHIGLVENHVLAADTDLDLGLWDDTEVTPQSLMDAALEMESAALEVPSVKQCGGAAAAFRVYYSALRTTNGFAGESRRTSFSRSCQAGASTDDGMEVDFDFSHRNFFEDLDAPAQVGRSAGERASKMLSGQKIKTGEMPVVFAPRVSNSFVQAFANSISGPAVAMGMSMLHDSMGKAICGDRVRIIDDPRRPRGIASRVFDGEGVASTRRELVKDGILSGWMLNYESASQLNLPLTGHADALGDGVSASNLYMAAGEISPQDLIHDITFGFYVTHLMGGGANTVTGDYSSGAGGFLIENGEITTPVKEATVAGHLSNMYKNMTPADDLEFQFDINAPTLRIGAMTVAGE